MDNTDTYYMTSLAAEAAPTPTSGGFADTKTGDANTAALRARHWGIIADVPPDLLDQIDL